MSKKKKRRPKRAMFNQKDLQKILMHTALINLLNAITTLVNKIWDILH